MRLPDGRQASLTRVRPADCKSDLPNGSQVCDYADGIKFIKIFCESSSGVEHPLATVRVAGSNPGFRSGSKDSSKKNISFLDQVATYVALA